MQCKGIVKDNLVILEEGVHLPEGATVIITVQSERHDEVLAPEELHQRQALVAHESVWPKTGGKSYQPWRPAPRRKGRVGQSCVNW